ncbi:MAG: cyclase family protein [Bacteroidales bacterium]|nr:cyclase family protein [Bacteroidales bacterium]
MPIVDLTHSIDNTTKGYPGTDNPSIKKACSYQEHGFVEHSVTFFTHTGTHIDAPAHLISEGKSLEEYTISSFYGKAILVDGHGKETITVDVFNEIRDELNDMDFVIIHTGWYRHWGSDNYFNNYPYIHSDCASFLAEKNIKGVGIDSISVDPIDTKNYDAHIEFMKKDLLIIENLTNLNQIKTKFFTFGCMPIKLNCSDGAPVRAFAII